MFLTPHALHFTGIGGIGMSGLAEVCLQAGCRVSGSDLKLSPLTERLVRLGARIAEGHAGRNLGDAAALVVTSAAAADNPEVAEARRRGIPILRRGELLAEMMRRQIGIAIGGSHGKTTTSAMTAAMALEAGLDPIVVVGGRVPELAGSNARFGAGPHFIAESDESDGSFLELSPTWSAITNIDREHLDHWGDLEGVKRAFVQFANHTAFYGAVVACIDDPVVRELLPDFRRRIITYGAAEDASLRIMNAASGASGSTFVLVRNAEIVGRFSLVVLGSHNILNATAAIGVGLQMGLPVEAMQKALGRFRGAARRMEVKGTARGVTVVDDYGHHPTEIRATLEALRLLQPRRLVVLFQPHRYTRTQSLLPEFEQCFRAADLVLVTDIYAASEPPIEGVTGAALAARAGAQYAGSLDDAISAAASGAREGDLIVTLGAGSVTSAGPRILEMLQG
jgi:UDP-N-acetylmuramate--alanine ligase